MKKNKSLHLDILGAGPAGIGIGYYAKKNKIPFSLFERSNRVGGNCKTIINGDYRYDMGAHRLHDKIDDITTEIKNLLGDELLKIEAPSKIYYKGSVNFQEKLDSNGESEEITVLKEDLLKLLSE